MPNDQEDAHGRSPARRRAPSNEGVRKRKIFARVDNREHAAITTVAGRVGMSTGAWLGDLATRHANGLLSPTPATWQAILQALVQTRAELDLTNALLRGISRHAAVHGEFESTTGDELATVESALCRIDVLTADAVTHAGHDR